MSATEKLLSITNQIGDLRYKLSHPDHFNLSEMQRNRATRQLETLNKIKEKLEHLTKPVYDGSEITCQQRCNWPLCSLPGCVIKQAW